VNPYGQGQYPNQNVNPYSNNSPNQGYNGYQGISQSYNPGYQQGMNQGYPMSSKFFITKILWDIQASRTYQNLSQE
jgi:hypothetical protein